MSKFPKIIDNERRKLLDCLIEASADFDEISIATGYWDLEATALLLPYLKEYKKIRLLIGREPLIPRHQLNEVEPDFPDKDIFEDLQKLKIDSNLKSTVKELKLLVDNKILEVKVFKKAFLHAKCYIFGNFESENAIGIIGSSNFTRNGLTTNRELNAGEDDQRVVQFNPKNKTQEHGHLSWFEEVWSDDGCIEWTGKFIELVDTSIHGELLFSPYDMSEYYKGKRTRNIYDPHSSEPFKLSRSKVDLFLNCPRCFYADRRLGVGRPPGFPFSLNSAVDALLKKEFDIHRANKTTHPLMKTYGIDAVPFEHEKMEEWRDSLRHGIQYLHEKTNLLITGGVDDVWARPNGELVIVDYKATSKSEEVTLDAPWQIGYKRQMEIYQWLFRKNGFQVSDTGYFVYCNGDADKEAFDGKLEFDVKIIPYEGDDAWVDQAITDAYACLSGDVMPPASEDCDYCAYFTARREVEEFSRGIKVV